MDIEALPENITTLWNANSLKQLPIQLPEDRVASYQARFLSTGPDAAIEVTANATRAYINGDICREENTFTDFVDSYEKSLTKAWLKFRRKTTDAVVLTGRWHMPEIGRGLFDCYLIHIVNTQGGARSIPYSAEVFDHDDHQSAMTCSLTKIIDDKSVDALSAWTKKLSIPLRDHLTEFGVPHSDGVAWMPDDPDLPVIFCHVEWLEGLDRRLLDRTLDPGSEGYVTEFIEDVSSPIALSGLMRCTRDQLYFYELEMDGELDFGRAVAHYNEEKSSEYSEVLLRKTSEIEGVQFCSDWLIRDEAFRYRILV